MRFIESIKEMLYPYVPLITVIALVLLVYGFIFLMLKIMGLI